MAELSRILRLEARRTAALPAVQVLAGVGIAAAWHGLVPGTGSALAAVGSAVRLMGPVAAGLAAWSALRERRLDYVRMLSARSPATGPALDLLLHACVALAAYGLVATVVLGYTLLIGGADRGAPATGLAGAAALVLLTVLGYLTGRLAGPRHPLLVAACVVLAGWLCMAARAHGGDWLGLLPPSAADARTGPRVPVAQLLWALGCAGLAGVGYCAVLARRRLVLLAPLAVAVAAATGGTLWLHSLAAAPAVSAARAGYTCHRWPLSICVDPALAAALPALEASITPLAVRLAGTPAAFGTVRQAVAGGPAGVRHGVAEITLPDLSPGYDHRAALALSRGLARCHPGAASLELLVVAWLADDEAPHPPGSGLRELAADRWTGWPEEQRRHWLHSHYGRFRGCRLTAADFTPAAPKPRPHRFRVGRERRGTVPPQR